MSNAIDKKRALQVEAEAMAWLAQIESGDLSWEDKIAFKEWLNRSARHKTEFQAAAALSSELGMLSELLEPLYFDAYAESKRRRDFVGARPFMAAITASFLLMILGVVIFSPISNGRIYTAYYATDIGEYLTVDLPEGSSIKLNTNTSLEVAYDKNERIIRLSKGEAFFEVAEDKSRPFLVYAGTNLARAVGTAFSVRLYDDKTELIVTEGIVEMTRRNLAAIDEQPTEATLEPVKASPPAVEVTAGYEYTSDFSTEDQETSEPVELTSSTRTSKLSWTEGLFDFSYTPLSEVITEVSRHTTLQIEIVDPALEDVEFGGIFRVGDVNTLLDALDSVGVSVERVNDEKVRLHSTREL